MEDKQAKIKAAREKLQAKYQGQQSTSSKVNRTKKVTRSSGPVNTKLKTIMKKVGAETIPDIAEVNFFTESGQVWRFKNPQVNGSIQNQTLFVTGTPEVQGKFASDHSLRSQSLAQRLVQRL